MIFPIHTPRVTLPFGFTGAPWYSEDRPHRGVDVAPHPGSFGELVRASVSGRVHLVGDHRAAGLEVVLRVAVPYSWGATGLRGEYVYFPAFEEFFIRTTHHQSALVKVGARVDVGEGIATVGSTGSASSGPHVHVEVRKGAYEDGGVVNPLDFFIAAIPGLREQLILPRG